MLHGTRFFHRISLLLITVMRDNVTRSNFKAASDSVFRVNFKLTAKERGKVLTEIMLKV